MNQYKLKKHAIMNFGKARIRKNETTMIQNLTSPKTHHMLHQQSTKKKEKKLLFESLTSLVI